MQTLALAPALLTLIAPLLPAGGGRNERASLDSANQQASDHSLRPTLSADGRHVAFVSAAPDLVAGDTNGYWDVFVRDRLAETTTRINVGPGGVQANKDSFNFYSSGRGPSLSAHGRYVAFDSMAANLVPVDTNLNMDCFVHDRDPDQNGVYDEGNGTTQLVSVDSNGLQYASSASQSPWISADGRFVAFVSLGRLHPADGNGLMDVYVRDRKLGTTHLVSRTVMGGSGNGESTNPVISGSGMYVAYESLATDLVGSDLNGVRDVFVTTWTSGLTTRVSVGPGGLEADGPSESPTISSSGLHVAFSSQAQNLHPDDQNGKQDVFAHDLTTGVTVPISMRPGGQTADDDSLHPSISTSGRFVAFESLATDMTAVQSYHFRDVFVFDRQLGSMRWASPAHIGASGYPHADGRSRWPSIGGSGYIVAFESEATQLVPGDSNDRWDVFVHAWSRVWFGPHK